MNDILLIHKKRNTYITIMDDKNEKKYFNNLIFLDYTCHTSNTKG